MQTGSIRYSLVVAFVLASALLGFSGAALAADPTTQPAEDCLDGCLDAPGGGEVGVMPGDNVQAPGEQPDWVPGGGVAFDGPVVEVTRDLKSGGVAVSFTDEFDTFLKAKKAF